MTSVFIDGAAGTTGLEIEARLAERPEFDLLILDESRRKDAAARRDALNAADIAILCLPDDAAREAVTLIDNPRTRVIDASSAHRVADGWTYGFPELGFDVAGAMRVSNPGCYPTGFLGFGRTIGACWTASCRLAVCRERRQRLFGRRQGPDRKVRHRSRHRIPFLCARSDAQTSAGNESAWRNSSTG